MVDPREVRLYMTDAAPDMPGQAVWAAACFGQGKNLSEALTSLQWAAANWGCRAVVALQVSHSLAATPGYMGSDRSFSSYVVCGTAVRYSA